jgi:hypothetical protein
MAEPAAPWSPVPEWTTAVLERDGWSARVLPGLGQTMVSGDLERATSELAPQSAECGLWGLVEGVPYRIRLARRNLLLVSAAPLGVAAGWRREGWAASPADDAFTVFELEGAALRRLVSEATSADIDGQSPSAAVHFAGVTGFVYRMAAARARVHVEAPFAAYVWRWLEMR